MPENVNFNSSYPKGSDKTIMQPTNKAIRKADALHEQTQKPNSSKTSEVKNRIKNK